jgi:hypothetical protein
LVKGVPCFPVSGLFGESSRQSTIEGGETWSISAMTPARTPRYNANKRRILPRHAGAVRRQLPIFVISAAGRRGGFG